MRFARRLRPAALGCLLLPVLGGCTAEVAVPASGGSETPVRGGTLIVAVYGDVDSWNPYTTHDATAAGILDLLYPRLLLETDSDRDGSSFEPWLASGWEFSADRLRLTFHLRPEATWSDGRPVTCADVRFTYEAQRDESLAWSGVFIKERIEGVDCPDEHTAVFRFSETYPDQLLDANDNAIVPSAYADVPFEDWAATRWEERILSCGPFRLAEVRPGQEAILERDAGWWEEAWLDRLIFRVYAETSAAVPRFLEGEVDLLPKVPPLRAAEVRSRDGLRLETLPSLSYTFLAWNVLEPDAYLADRKKRCGAERCLDEPADLTRLQAERPHFALAERNVRRALTLAIDREDIVRGLWGGHALVGTSPVVSALWAHEPSTALPFDPGQAGTLLDAAGWIDRDGDGIRERDGRRLELRVIFVGDNAQRRDALVRVAANLERVGVRLVPEPLPRAEFVARARDKAFDGAISGWWAGTRIQPQNHLHTRAAINRGNNLGSWSTPESDALMDRAATAADRAEALPLWRGWQRIFREEQPITILYEERRLLGTSARVQGPAPSFLDPFQKLHRAWVLPDARDEG